MHFHSCDPTHNIPLHARSAHWSCPLYVISLPSLPVPPAALQPRSPLLLVAATELMQLFLAQEYLSNLLWCCVDPLGEPEPMERFEKPQGRHFPLSHGLHWSLQIIANQLLARVMYRIAPSRWR